MSKFRFIRCAVVFSTLGVSPLVAHAQAVVAVLDTGVNVTPDLKNNIAPGGFNYVNGTMNTTDDSSNNHGTAVARSIVSVDDRTLILPLLTIDGDFNRNKAAVDAGYAHATADETVRIINHSNGNVNPASPQAIVNAGAAGKLVVVNAGNDSQPNHTGDARTVPQLGGRGMIVGASNGKGDGIADFSNRAGGFADHFILAKPSNGFTSSVGTSMSAARVSGVAAAIFNQAPFLSPEEVSQIIFESATDVGAPGVDKKTGWGVLDSKAALEPAGDLSAGGGGGGSSGGAVVAVAVAAGAGIAYAISRRNKNLKKTVVIDDFGRGYYIDLTQQIHAVRRKPDLLSLLNPGERETRTAMLVDNARHQVIAVGSRFTPEARLRPEHYNPFSATSDVERDTRSRFSVYGESADGSTFGLDINANPQQNFGALGALPDQHAGNQFLAIEAFSTPYLGFSDDGVSSRFGRRLNEDVSFKFGYASLNDGQRFGTESNAVLFEGTVEQDRLTVNLQVGQLMETGGMFGGSSGGAFSVDDTATLSLGLSGAYRLTDRISLIGNYAEGYSDIADDPASLLQKFSGVRSNTFGVGLIADDMFTRHDQVGIAWSQPLRVTDGSADLNVPTSQNLRTGAVHSTSGRVSLVPEGAEHALEAYYRFRINDNTNLTSYLMYQQEPLHDGEASGATTLFATLQHRF